MTQWAVDIKYILSYLSSEQIQLNYTDEREVHEPESQLHVLVSLNQVRLLYFRYTAIW